MRDGLVFSRYFLILTLFIFTYSNLCMPWLFEIMKCKYNLKVTEQNYKYIIIKLLKLKNYLDKTVHTEIHVFGPIDFNWFQWGRKCESMCEPRVCQCAESVQNQNPTPSAHYFGHKSFTKWEFKNAGGWAKRDEVYAMGIGHNAFVATFSEK